MSFESLMEINHVQIYANILLILHFAVLLIFKFISHTLISRSLLLSA